MRNFKAAIAVCSTVLMLAHSANAVAGMFDALIEKAVRGAAEQAVSGAVNNAVNAPVQPAASAVPFLQNGCYVNFPPMPPSAASHQADVDRNGCIDYNEMSMYMQVYRAHTANAQAQPAAAPSGGGFFGALAGAAAQQAVSGRGAPALGGLSGLTGKGAAFVAANQAIGAIGQTQQANNAANAPAMANSQAAQVAMSNPQNVTGNDDLWEVVTKIEMPGMPMAIPPQTSRICAQAGKMRNEDKIPQDKNCSVLESRQSGDKYTFSMACEQNGTQMTGSGEVISSRDRYQGTVRSQATAGGQAMNVTTNFSGKKVGNCTFGG